MVKKHWILLITVLLISTGFIFSQNSVELFSDTAKSYERYLNLFETHQNYQNKLMDSLDYFERIRNEDYVLNAKDIKFINLELTKGILLLEQSIVFYKTGEKHIKSYIDSKLDKNHICFLNLLFTYLRIKSFETYTLLQKIIGQNTKITNLINEDNLLYRKKKNSLKNISKKIVSRKFRKSTIKIWNNTKVSYCNNRSDKIIRQIVLTDYYQNFLSNNEKIKESKKYFRMLVKQRRIFNAKMIINDSERKILYLGSKIFGNFVGGFASRKGKLLNNEDFIRNSKIPFLIGLE
ncbi:MAG: hypothetical protein U9Q84_06595 [Thermodesulfobacteriota bacterium]|nr:hypothetical protein [Thermodesulfobacteriota bacterium]